MKIFYHFFTNISFKMRIVIQVANCKPVQLSLCLYNASAYPFFKSPFEVRHRLRAVRQVRGIALMFSPCGEGYQRAHKKGTHGLRSFPFAPFTCLSIVKEYRGTNTPPRFVAFVA